MSIPFDDPVKLLSSFASIADADQSKLGDPNKPDEATAEATAAKPGEASRTDLPSKPDDRTTSLSESGALSKPKSKSKPNSTMAGVTTAVKLLGSRIPLLLKTTVFQSLGISEESSKWDLRQALIITTLRSIMAGSTTSITQQQKFSLGNPPVKGPMWISTATLPVPDDDVRQLLFRVIGQMNVTGAETYTKPAAEPVEAEWTGHRSGVGKNEPTPPGLSEQDKYIEMMKDVKSDVTILYFHGGAYYLMDPASHRGTTSRLARMTKGRAFSVRYRLAPQYPFPAAILDCIIAYLSLIYPPPGSFHSAVKPEHIIFAGDSAGGNMCLSLLLFLLHLRHTGQTTVRWHGKDVQVPLPGGVAPNSAWADITHSLPSWKSNAKWDYLPATLKADIGATKNTPMPPACEAWPSNPPRADLYCDGPTMCHPLASPLAAKAEVWKDSPPLMFIYGQEMLGDEGKVIAQRAVRMGVKVWFEEYEAMPHVFLAMFDGTPVSDRCYESWAGWMDKVVAGKEVPHGALWIEAKTFKETPMPVEALTKLSDEEVSAAMDRERERRIEWWDAMLALQAPEKSARL